VGERIMEHALFELFVVCGLIAVLGCVAAVGYEVHDYNSRVLEKIDSVLYELDRVQRLDMYAEKVENDTKINGVYFYDGYYCVWTKGREKDVSKIDPRISRIDETAVHELTHALIHNDYYHFCGEAYDNND